MAEKEYTLSDFDFELPAELLAEYPAQKRDHSRLMVISKSQQSVNHHSFYEIPDFFERGDLFVLNDTKVVPAKLWAHKQHPKAKGAFIRVLLVRPVLSEVPGWHMLLDPMKKLREGTILEFGDQKFIGKIEKINSEKEATVIFPQFASHEELKQALFSIGQIPLPPYIKRGIEDLDKDRYQTLYAASEGALAAPTAGLHFSKSVFDQLTIKGVDRAFLTLRIGIGTFNPIYKEDLSEIEMHKEDFVISDETAAKINAVKKTNRILAVGTTSLRALESSSSEDGEVMAGSSSSDLFIKPGYRFNTDTALLTNFHTPKSTLLMLISAFMGYEFTRDVYAEAVREKYRFFSYGDAMLILP